MGQHACSLAPHTAENTGGLTEKEAGFVRGAAKAVAHLMFGIIALTAKQLFHLIEREKAGGRAKKGGPAFARSVSKNEQYEADGAFLLWRGF